MYFKFFKELSLAEPISASTKHKSGSHACAESPDPSAGSDPNSIELFTLCLEITLFYLLRATLETLCYEKSHLHFVPGLHGAIEQMPEFDHRTQNRASVFVQMQINNRINRSTRVLESRFTAGLCLAMTFVVVCQSFTRRSEETSLIYEQLTKVRSVAP